MTAAGRSEGHQFLDRGYLAYENGDFVRAQADLQSAQELFADEGNGKGMAAALTNLGAAHAATKDFEQAIACLHRAIQLHRDLQDPEPLAMAMATYSLAGVLAESGRYFRAGSMFVEAAELFVAIHKGDIADAALEKADALRRVTPTDVPPAEHELIDDLRASQCRNLHYGDVAWGNDNLTDAVNCWATAQQVSEALEDDAVVAYLAVQIGGALLAIGDVEGALRELSQRLTLIRNVGRKDMLATALNNIGYSYFRLGRGTDASPVLDEAFELRTGLGDVGGAAESLANLAFAHELNGKPDAAVLALRQASVLYLQAGDERASQSCLDLASKCERGTGLEGDASRTPIVGDEESTEKEVEQAEAEGNYEAAAAAWMKLLHLARLASNRERQAEALIGIGYSLRRAGDRSQAVIAYLEALTSARQAGAQSMEGRALNNLGVVYADINKEAALDFLAAAAQVRSELPDRHELGETVFSLANLLSAEAARGEAERALDLINPDRAPRTWAAALDLALKGLEEQDSLALKKRYSETIRKIGYERLQVGETQSPIDSTVLFKLHDMLELEGKGYGLLVRRAAEGTDPNQVWKESVTLAHVLWQSGQTDEAIAQILSAIDDVERIGDQITSLPAQRAFYRESFGVFDAAIHYLTATDRLDEAVEVIERSKCRALLQAVQAIDAVRVSSQPDFMARLRAAERAHQHCVDQVIESGRLAIRGDDPVLRSAKAELARCSSELNNIRRLLGESPEADTPRLAFGLSADEIQSACLGPRHAFLVFWLGTSTSGAFVVSRDLVRYVSMPGRDVVHSYVRELHDALTKLPRGRASLDRLLSLENFSWLEPVLKALADGNYEHVTIIPHYVLHGIPFHALAANGICLSDRYLIDYSPNVSFFRASVTAIPSQSDQVTLTVIADTTGDLDYSVDEVEQIKRAWSRYDVIVAKPEAATDAFRAGLERSDITHVACHAKFGESADWEIRLALSSHHERAMTLRDITRTAHVRDGGMVVLSACNSARSNITQTDELIGLAGGLLVAGASAIVGSLWAVDDWATSLLMGEFHRRLAAGESHAEALRGAQRWLRKLEAREFVTGAANEMSVLSTNDQPFVNPYYWAGFFPIGHWKRIPSANGERNQAPS